MSGEQAKGIGTDGAELAAALRDEATRLHAERGPLVVIARRVRMENGVSSTEFAKAWFDVERVTRDLEDVELSLSKVSGGEVAHA